MKKSEVTIGLKVIRKETAFNRHESGLTRRPQGTVCGLPRLIEGSTNQYEMEVDFGDSCKWGRRWVTVNHYEKLKVYVESSVNG